MENGWTDDLDVDAHFVHDLEAHILVRHALQRGFTSRSQLQQFGLAGVDINTGSGLTLI
jgi:hypothetical protein